MHRPGSRVGLAGGLLAGALGVAACGGGGGSGKGDDVGGIVNNNISLGQQGTATPQPEARITISDNAFGPPVLNVKAGTKVVWEWTGKNPHSVLLGGQSSGDKTGSGTYDRSFDTPGTTVNYQCGIHGAAMSGKIVVE